MADSRASKTSAIYNIARDGQSRPRIAKRDWRRLGFAPFGDEPGLEFALVAADVKSSHPFAISTGVP